MRSIAPFLIFAAALTGCSVAPEPVAIKAFKPKNPTSNAVTLATFVKQQCFGRQTNLEEFEAALKATGWSVKKTQSASVKNPISLDVWSIPYITVIRGQPATGAVWTCSIALAASVAPTPDVVRSALSNAASAEPDTSGNWWWKQGSDRLHMDIEASRDGGVFITVEDYRLPWWRNILG